MRMIRWGSSLVLALALAGTVYGQGAAPGGQGGRRRGGAGSETQNAPTVELKPTQGNTAAGTIQILPMGGGVHFSGTITGLTPGPHGFHVHQTGDCSAPDAASAGGHFNPTSKQHGAPTDAEHHAGDLGNITADASGKASVSIHSDDLSLDPSAPNSVLGKALIVHAAPDDMKSQPSGNAGARVACGVIK